MGYNTVLLLRNDNMEVGTRDPEIGQKILDAELHYHMNCADKKHTQIYAEALGGTIAHYGEVVAVEHTSVLQVLVVGQNTGFRVDLDGDVPPEVLRACAAALENRGWTVQEPEQSGSGF
jgi:hypothetical protein